MMMMATKVIVFSWMGFFNLPPKPFVGVTKWSHGLIRWKIGDNPQEIKALYNTKLTRDPMPGFFRFPPHFLKQRRSSSAKIMASML